MKDEEIQIEEIEDSHKLGGVGEVPRGERRRGYREHYSEYERISQEKHLSLDLGPEKLKPISSRSPQKWEFRTFDEFCFLPDSENIKKGGSLWWKLINPVEGTLSRVR